MLLNLPRSIFLAVICDVNQLQSICDILLELIVTLCSVEIKRGFNNREKDSQQLHRKHCGEANTNPWKRSTIFGSIAEELCRRAGKAGQWWPRQRKNKKTRTLDIFLYPFCSFFSPAWRFHPLQPLEPQPPPRSTDSARFERMHSVTYFSSPATGETSSFNRDGGGGWTAGYFLRCALKIARSCQANVEWLAHLRRNNVSVGRDILSPGPVWTKLAVSSQRPKKEM